MNFDLSPAVESDEPIWRFHELQVVRVWKRVCQKDVEVADCDSLEKSLKIGPEQSLENQLDPRHMRRPELEPPDRYLVVRFLFAVDIQESHH